MCLAAGGLVPFGIAVAVALAATGVQPRALQLVGAFWAVYGLGAGFVGGVLEPVVDGLARAVTDVGQLEARRFS